MSRGAGVLVYSERNDVALELIAAGHELAVAFGAPLWSLLSGPGDAPRASDHIRRGADEALVVAGADPFEALWQAALARDPRVILIGGTVLGAEIASRLAQRLRIGCASDVAGVVVEEGTIVVERRMLGRFLCRQAFDLQPAIVTIAPHRYAASVPQEGRKGRIETLLPERSGRPGPPSGCPGDAAVGRPGAAPPRLVRTRVRQQSGDRIDTADIIVAAGRGVRTEADLAMIRDLAGALGGAVGATRPLTDDLRWLPSNHKVGLSGETVHPRLYIACGLSGQIEHLVGMWEAEVVVAINSDPNAPIMEHADYRLVGDLYRVVPALTRAVQLRVRSGPGVPR